MRNTIIILFMIGFFLPGLSGADQGFLKQDQQRNFKIGVAEKDPLSDEGVGYLTQYLAIDTTNPPGNEMAAARFLKKILDREGIENTIFDLGNNRANFYAVLRGNQAKKPVVLLHHMDVVPADEKFWKVPPFSGKIINGRIYGRGAIDIKGKGIIDLMALITLKRRKIPLSRDIILLGVADEEGDSLGARWMIKEKPELIRDAEFLVDEGESIDADNSGKTLGYCVSVGEKYPLWLNLVFTGKSGHGYVPDENSAVNRLLRDANRILAWRQEPRILPETIGTIRSDLKSLDYKAFPGFSRDLETSLKNQVFLKKIMEEPSVKAAVSNTIAITSLKGSNKINTIPNEATLGMDCRLLPGVNPEDFIGELRKVINDPDVRINIETMLVGVTTSSSPVQSDFTSALARMARKYDPGAEISPVLLLSSTDSVYFRSIGIKTYGFEAYRLNDDEANLSHSNDEYLSVANLKFGIVFMSDFLSDLCGTDGKKRRFREDGKHH